MPIGSAVADSGIAVRTCGRVNALSRYVTRQFAGVALIVGALAWMYADVLTALTQPVGQRRQLLARIPDPPLAAYFAWERRARCWRLTRRRAVRAGRGRRWTRRAPRGILGAELFLTRDLDAHRARRRRAVRLGWRALRRAGLPARLPAADDSDPGDHLQPDRVSAAAAGVASRRVHVRRPSAFRCCGKATLSSSPARRSRSPKPAAASDR